MTLNSHSTIYYYLYYNDSILENVSVPLYTRTAQVSKLLIICCILEVPSLFVCIILYFLSSAPAEARFVFQCPERLYLHFYRIRYNSFEEEVEY